MGGAQNKSASINRFTRFEFFTLKAEVGPSWVPFLEILSCLKQLPCYVLRSSIKETVGLILISFPNASSQGTYNETLVPQLS